MKIVVQFDGKSFVPIKPVSLAVGTEVEFEVDQPDAFEVWIKQVEQRGPLPYVDVESLDRGDLYP